MQECHQEQARTPSHRRNECGSRHHALETDPASQGPALVVHALAQMNGRSFVDQVVAMQAISQHDRWRSCAQLEVGAVTQSAKTGGPTSGRELW
jgi:hypothetical protein